MRANDLTPPVYTPAALGPGSPLAAWAAIPRVVLERLPTVAYAWDDEDPAVVWDAAGDPYVWDAPTIGAGFVDATCDFQAIELEAGNPDELNLYQSARALVTLDNRAGDWSVYDESGRLVYFAPGRRLHVLADYAGATWWLFSGTIDTWDVTTADGSVSIEAHDRFSLLAAEIGTYTPGTAGQKPAARLGAIAAAAGDTGTRRTDPGDVTLTAQETDRSPLEEMQTVTLSDGGLLYVDADGALVYRDRLWPRGRNDQTGVDVFSDNVCDAPAIVWDLELATEDEHLATSVHLANVAGVVVDAATDDPLWADRPYPYTHPDLDQWTTAAEGQALADTLLDLYDDPKVGIRRFELHLLDPQQDLWRVGVDRRLGDRIRFLHDFPAAGGATGTFDVTAVVSTITHQITPEAWVVGIGTGPAVDATPVQRWDRTAWLWDDPDAVWDY